MKTSEKVDNVAVVIRSVGERTTELCYQLACEQVISENIHIIKERPFSAAIKKTFEIGIELNRFWTLALDADILILPGEIKKMTIKASCLDDYFFVYQGMILDKIYCNCRVGGPHLYRTQYLDIAINAAEKTSKFIRPESSIYDIMAKDGYHFFFDAVVYGLHDFQQSYFDLYRKSFVHARKHADIIPTFISGIGENWHKDFDFKVIIGGITDGLLYNGDILLKPAFFKTRFEEFCNRSQIEEKEPLSFNNKLLHEYPLTISSAYGLPNRQKRISRLKHKYVTRSDNNHSFTLMDWIYWKLEIVRNKMVGFAKTFFC